MYANFQKLSKSKEYKDLMWEAAAAYTLPEVEEKMEDLKKINKDAHAWLLKEPPSNWARCYYTSRAKCNRMGNNVSESFNDSIKEARNKPVLTMMDTIWRQIMKRYQERIQFSQSIQHNLCPRYTM